MKLSQPAVIYREIPARQLAKLEAEARARELEAMRANPSMPMPVLVHGRAPGVRVEWPSRR